MAGNIPVTFHLTLKKGENKETTLFRLEKGNIIYFVLDASLSDKHVRLFVNHPESAKSGHHRRDYRELDWLSFSAHKSDIYDVYAQLPLVLAGSFHYYFTIDNSDKKDSSNGCGNILVNPVLISGKYNEKLHLDAICCQSVLSKLLGPFPEWEGRLEVAKESGYNMIHFTPLQELGKSNSAYCLKDQLKLNPTFCPDDKCYTFDDVERLVNKMATEWGVLSLTDLVYNHTANESPWIREHPECAYNLVNSPHLKPAYIVDRILWHFSEDVTEGKFADRGVPAEIRNDGHLKAMEYLFWNELMPRHNIHEFFMVHVDDTLHQFRIAISSGIRGDDRTGEKLHVVPDPRWRRLKATVDISLAIKLFYTQQSSSSVGSSSSDYVSESDHLHVTVGALRHELERLNRDKFKEVQSHLAAAVSNLVANARWRFIDDNGPKIARVCHEKEQPIMWNYFTLPAEPISLEQEIANMDTDLGAHCMAHNGWVMNDDPLRNFAEPGSNIYLRRELLPWGDSVKLRYGSKPEDCPYLWEHMRQYTVQAAGIFHGVRLDNCHSTPLHVAEYMLHEARQVRPDLYIIAELFTSSEHMDNMFINKLGLTSLIREALTAHDSHEQGRLVHRYGGEPVGAFMQPVERPLAPSLAHAIFFDQTHDNPSPIEKRTALDLLPSTALVAMANCASGSNRGYDEMVPHHINVVTENRMYQSWSDNPRLPGVITNKSGIIRAKKALNLLHQNLAQAGFNQVYVDQVDKDIVSVTRHNPVSHQSVILISRTAFHLPPNMDTGYVPPLCVPGVVNEIVMEARVCHQSGSAAFKQDANFLNGLSDHVLHIREHIKVTESEMVELRDSNDPNVQELEFIKFPPASILVVKVTLNSSTKESVLNIRQALGQFGYRVKTFSARNMKEISSTTLENIASTLTLNDLNRVLYRCNAEEKDDGKGFGAYNIPGYGDLVYCGLQGLVCVLNRIRPSNELGHPLCENLRNGDWMMDYMSDRLKAHPGTETLGVWFAKVFENVRVIPRYLIPRYFDAIVTGVYQVMEEMAWAKMSDFVKNGSSFVRALGMGSLQFCSYLKTAELPALSPNLSPPLPPAITDPTNGTRHQTCVTLAAGLPHFASGIFRNWGRDTFISFRGLLLLTGRFQEARYIILAYGGTVRHGLIPNLLGGGTHARYNCRDAVWWWLQCVQDYCSMVKGGHSILTDNVTRMYPADDDQPQAPGTKEQMLHEVIQEVLQRHADCIQYRERNAGLAIDNDMAVEGFDVKVGVNWGSALVYGGNVHNCGTWMDKNGSSVAAGNKGQPATPRDGSAVELVGLSRSALRWVSELADTGLFPHPGITRRESGHMNVMSYSDWAFGICHSFEKAFWVNTKPVPEKEPKPDLINRRGIYKDSYGASQFWADYQLRPNFPIAMVVAPEMFTPENAWIALSMAQKHLLGPLGMKTLDPSDWAYNGNYVNSDLSKGWNYHQGPEWVWPIGYFLRAKLHFAQVLECSRPGLLKETISFVQSTLSQHNVHLQNSDWKSLPELTNKDGAVCHDSCAAQAWSMGCVLEVLHDMELAQAKLSN